MIATALRKVALLTEVRRALERGPHHRVDGLHPRVGLARRQGLVDEAVVALADELRQLAPELLGTVDEDVPEPRLGGGGCGEPHPENEVWNADLRPFLASRDTDLRRRFGLGKELQIVGSGEARRSANVTRRVRGERAPRPRPTATMLLGPHRFGLVLDMAEQVSNTIAIPS
jgi:hypothetical protein